MTFIATVPCAFILLASPFHAARLRSTDRGLIPRSLLHVGKVVFICLMLVLTLLDLASTLWLKLRTERDFAPVYIVTPIALHISLCIAGTSTSTVYISEMFWIENPAIFITCVCSYVLYPILFSKNLKISSILITDKSGLFSPRQDG